MDVQYQRKTLETKVACLGRSINWKYGHQVALPHRRAYAPAGNTTTFDDQENCNSWILISAVLRLATHRVTELQNEWGNVHDYILRTRRPSLGYVVAVVSTHLISSHLISSLIVPAGRLRIFRNTLHASRSFADAVAACHNYIPSHFPLPLSALFLQVLRGVAIAAWQNEPACMPQYELSSTLTEFTENTYTLVESQTHRTTFEAEILFEMDMAYTMQRLWRVSRAVSIFESRRHKK